MAMGHNPKTLTAANSIVLFKAEGYYDSFIQIQGFQADNAFNFGDATVGETRMGVDGKQSGGWVAHETDFTLYLEANSISKEAMENFVSWCNQGQEASKVTFEVTLPSTGKRTVASGFLTTKSGGTSAQSLLAGSQYVFRLVNNGEESI